MKASAFESFWLQLYGRIRSERGHSIIRKLVVKLEGGPAFSLSIRKILRRYHGLEIGLYSNWPFRQKPAIYQPGTSIGRYAVIAETARTFTRNHTTNTKSTHGFFDNPLLGKVSSDLIPWGALFVGHGVSLGHNCIILPPTQVIGEGAVIQPGAVVCGNVAPYAIMSGFPARTMGYRFGKEKIAQLIESRWWEKPPAELGDCEATKCR